MTRPERESLCHHRPLTVAEEAELAALIAGQERDMRWGHRVHTRSLDGGRESEGKLLDCITETGDLATRKKGSHLSEARHGTTYARTVLLCSCDDCRRAVTVARRKARDKARAEDRASYHRELAVSRRLKETYRGTCRLCGEKTTGCGGPGRARDLCNRCSPRVVGLRLRGNGKRQKQLFSLLHERGEVRFTEVVESLGYHHPGGAGVLLHNALRYGYIERVRRGVYRLSAPMAALMDTASQRVNGEEKR